ncbi:MAG: TPM domain-containing protein [Treponema sp.]|nr:TPM domain-containing protein [Treponema sp.]
MRVKKITLILILAACFSAAVSAQDRRHIVDSAGILSQSQIADLEQMLDSVSQAYHFDLAIAAVKDTGGKTATAYADDYYDYGGYGYGENRDGCLFLQVTETREYAFSSTGSGIKLLNPYANSVLVKKMIPLMTAGDYYGAYTAYINFWKEILNLAANNRNYNFFYKNSIALTAGAWALAFLIGFLIITSWKKGMNTALMQTKASAYIVNGSLNFTLQKDRFLYSVVSKSERQQSGSSGGGNGRTGSSGTSHGGSSGRY